MSAVDEQLHARHLLHLMEVAGLTPEMAAQAAVGARLVSPPSVGGMPRQVWWEYRYGTPELAEAPALLRWRLPLSKDEQQAVLDAALGVQR